MATATVDESTDIVQARKACSLNDALFIYIYDERAPLKLLGGKCLLGRTILFHYMPTVKADTYTPTTPPCTCQHPAFTSDDTRRLPKGLSVALRTVLSVLS